MAFGKSRKPQLRLIEDGPLEYRGAHGGESDAILTDAAGNPMKLTGGERLCRCGGSSMKPYCDSTHLENGFSDKRVRHVIPAARRDYTAGVLTIHDVRGMCAHVEHCINALPEVFRSGQTPWIDASAAPVEQIVRVIRACPSGALTYSIDGVYYGDWAGPPKIDAEANGPYEVSGSIDMPGVEFASTVPHDHIALCRCGGSRNKPFCDGTHWHNGFVDPGASFAGGESAMTTTIESGDHGGPGID